MRFFLIDKITEWEPGCSGCAIKNVSLTEDFFDDHFPSTPIMPGVLIVEGMAQLSGLILSEGVRQETGERVKALLSIVEKAKFRRVVRPGDTLEYRAEIISANESGGKAKVSAYVGEERVTDCVLVFSLHPITDPSLDARRAELLSLWLGEDGQTCVD